MDDPINPILRPKTKPKIIPQNILASWNTYLDRNQTKEIGHIWKSLINISICLMDEYERCSTEWNVRRILKGAGFEKEPGAKK